MSWRDILADALRLVPISACLVLAPELRLGLDRTGAMGLAGQRQIVCFYSKEVLGFASLGGSQLYAGLLAGH